MAKHAWRFFRAGGFDQVALDDAADFRSLGELDQKLWVALACPADGLSLPAESLRQIDQNGDGRIRAPELIESIQWLARVLRDIGEIARRKDGLPLTSINPDTPDGAHVLATARRVLAGLERESEGTIRVADAEKATAIFNALRLNGDGVLRPDSTEDAALSATIREIIDTVGSVPDRSGEPGVDAALVTRFFDEAVAHLAWLDEGAARAAAIRTLGDGTAGAASAIDAVRAKVDDFFTRCDLAAFDPRSAAHLARAADSWGGIASRMLSPGDAEIAEYPLATIEPGRDLPLDRGINPAWRAALATLRERVVLPVLGERSTLSLDDWNQLKARFGDWNDWQTRRAGTSVASLDEERLRALVASDTRANLDVLIAEDGKLKDEADALGTLVRAARLYRDAHQLLDNFVSFRDFYAKRDKATFQAGTLFLDGRSCELCLSVADLGKHSAGAGASHAFVAYCECTRKGGAEKRTIAAIFTDGDSDFLAPGRNGIFYDRDGNDWDATIVKVVENPISIRQAFWTPYRKVAKLINDQVEKFASDREKAVNEKAAAGVTDGATKIETAAPPAAGAEKAAPAAFDIGKFAGIFAAIGLAIGIVGSALAALLTGFLSLKLWQMPLAIAGVILLISGPSMLIAALKLRQRNLGPLLDANGWAVNARARINIPFGKSLTQVAALPEGASRSLVDPYKDKKQPIWLWILLGLVVFVLAILWDSGWLSKRWDAWLGSAKEPAPAAETAPKG